jgi:hypothetical protein
MTKALRNLLIVLDAFLAVTAVAGGIGLLAGANTPALEWLEGSLFRTYTIPGLALLVIVGGCALAATALMLRRHPWGALTSGLAGMMIMSFEIVEVLVIGSPPGIARILQVFYFALGLLSVVVAAGMWATERRPAAQT